MDLRGVWLTRRLRKRKQWQEEYQQEEPPHSVKFKHKFKPYHPVLDGHPQFFNNVLTTRSLEFAPFFAIYMERSIYVHVDYNAINRVPL